MDLVLIKRKMNERGRHTLGDSKLGCCYYLKRRFGRLRSRCQRRGSPERMGIGRFPGDRLRRGRAWAQGSIAGL